MRPWIIQLGPMFVPTGAREELMAARETRTAESYVSWVWRQRVSGSVYPASGNGWPYGKSDELPVAVTKLEAVKRR